MQIPGAGGWAFNDELQDGGEVYVRLDEAGHVVELYLRKEGAAITPGDLRHLALTQIRARAIGLRPDLQRGLDMNPGRPDVRSEVRRAFPETWLPQQSAEAVSQFVLSPHASEGGLTDTFLRDVARAYRDAVARGLRPNKALAEQTKFGVRTVEKWVYLARKAGHLEPTRKGSVG